MMMMKTSNEERTRLSWVTGLRVLAVVLAGLWAGGCASTSSSSGDGGAAKAAPNSGFGTAENKKFKRTDKIDRVWLAEGFDFNGYDVLLVDEVKVDSAVKPKDEKEADRLSLMQGTLSRDISINLESRKIFKTVTLKASDVVAGAKALKMQMTITKFSRGSTAARIGVGFGAGMPYVRVVAKVSEIGSGREVFEAELDETADWFGAGYSSSQTLQTGAAMELSADLANYMSRVARRESVKYK